MSDVTIPSASFGEVSVCNALGASPGIHVGGGAHVAIPSDWQSRLINGVDVPGCTYFQVDLSGSLIVTDDVQNKLSDTNLTKNLDQPSVTSLQQKITLAKGSVTGSVDVVVG